MIRVAVLLGLAVTLPARAAEPPALGNLAGKVDQMKAGTETLAGEFTQTTRVKLFKQELTSKGRFFFRKPRQIRWQYTTPDPSLLVVDGNQVRMTTPGAAAQQFDLDKDPTMRAIVEQLILWLGPGRLAAAGDDYELATAGTSAAPVLVLTPKPASAIAKAFARIELRLDVKTWLMKSVRLVEKGGDEKEIEFVKLQRNGPLPADAFR